jgi:hypothetical protein
MNHRILLILISVISTCSVFSQTHFPESYYDEPPKNALFVTFGLRPGFKTFTGQYERVIIKRSTFLFNAVGINLGMGFIREWEQYKNGVGTTGSANIFTYFGKKAAHLDISAGLVYTFPESVREFGSERPESLYPSFTLSFRYQQPLGAFFLRSGIGFPDMIHLSLGYCF